MVAAKVFGDTDEEQVLISVFKRCGWGFSGATFLSQSLTFRRNGMHIFLRFNDDGYFEIIDTHNDKIYSDCLGDPKCIEKLKVALSRLDFGSFLL